MKDNNLSDFIILRLKAEEYLKKLQSNSDLQLSEFDNLKIINELLVYQIALKMQNDKLVIANVQMSFIAEKYIDKYKFSPLCYFKLTNEGEIVELNLQGSQLLCKDLVHLIGSRFGFFVINVDKPVYNLFLEKVFISKVNETCLISLSLDDNPTKHVILTGKITIDGKHCLISAIDNTEFIESDIRNEQSNSYFINKERNMLELKKEINELLIKGGGENKYSV